MAIGCKIHGQQWSLKIIGVLCERCWVSCVPQCVPLCNQTITHIWASQKKWQSKLFFFSLYRSFVFWHFVTLDFFLLCFSYSTLDSSEYSSDSLALWSCILPGGTPWQLCFPVSPPGVRRRLCCRHLFTCFRHGMSEFNNRLAVDLDAAADVNCSSNEKQRRGKNDEALHKI